MSPLPEIARSISRRERDEEERLARLLAAAGPPPPAPELEIARIQEVARSEWRRRYAWRRHQRRVRRFELAAAAAAAVVATLAFLLWPRAERPRAVPAVPVLAAVDRVAGEALVTSAAGAPARRLAAGEPLAAGCVVRTAVAGEAPGHLALRWSDGRSLRLAAGSEVALAAADRIELRRGAVYLDSSGAAPGDGPTVVTPRGRFDEVGTQFEVRLGADEPGSVRLRVREGSVEWHENGRSATAEAGVELALAADGSLVRAAAVPFGDEWAWVLAAAPTPAIEGWSLARFLAWYGREAGLAVDYADATSARLAAGVVVHGAIDRLAPSEALAAVLKSSGFTARVEGGRLVVAALGDEAR